MILKLRLKDGYKQIQKGSVYKEKILQNKSKRIVGLSWNTKSSLTQAFQRNIKLKNLLLPLKNLDLKFINLQYGDVSEKYLI